MADFLTPSSPIALKRILLVIKESTDPNGIVRRQVEAFWKQYNVLVEARSMDFTDTCPNLKTPDFKPDVIIVIGGDGTFLRTARCFAQDAIPMVGINRGHLGFLTRIEVSELDAYMQRIHEGAYLIEERTMLHLNDHPDRGYALNDVVFKGCNPSQLVRLDLWLGASLVAQYDTDGLIVSTATGSTAYNLAAGGPVLAPSVEALCITPICPHSFSAKPIVIPSDTPIRVQSPASNTQEVNVSMDGQALGTMIPGESVVLTKAPKGLPWLNFTEDKEAGFYHLLSRKLRWAENPRERR
jgi:NAD+ kinase